MESLVFSRENKSNQTRLQAKNFGRSVAFPFNFFNVKMLSMLSRSTLEGKQKKGRKRKEMIMSRHFWLMPGALCQFQGKLNKWLINYGLVSIWPLNLKMIHLTLQTIGKKSSCAPGLTILKGILVQLLKTSMLPSWKSKEKEENAQKKQNLFFFGYFGLNKSFFLLRFALSFLFQWMEILV